MHIRYVPWWYCCILLLVLAGCAPTKSSQVDTPPIVLPQTFSQSGERVVDSEWWDEFDTPHLKNHIEKALANNFTRRAARQRLLQAQALSRISAAELSPQLDATGGFTTSRSRTDGRTTTSDDIVLGLAASYEVDLWGRIRAEEDAARLDEQGSAEDLQAAAHSIAAEVAGTWFELAEAYSQLDLLQQQQELNTLGLQLIQMRFNTGQVGIADVLQQRQLIESKSGEQAQQRAAGQAGADIPAAATCNRFSPGNSEYETGREKRLF